jgi:hypothetical protein
MLSGDHQVAHVQRHSIHAALRVLHARGWEQRLQPLAAHMAAQHLVRSRSEVGAPLRHLDLVTLRTALGRLLSQYDGDQEGLLIHQLVVDGADPAQVAVERGVSRPALVEQLRDAIDDLAVMYEEIANAALGQMPGGWGSRSDRV